MGTAVPRVHNEARSAAHFVAQLLQVLRDRYGSRDAPLSHTCQSPEAVGDDHPDQGRGYYAVGFHEGKAIGGHPRLKRDALTDRKLTWHADSRSDFHR